MITLYVISGPMKGSSIELEEGTNFIGRAPENDIQLKDKSISRKHAKILLRDNHFFVEDLKSQNGTWIEDKAIVPGRQYEVKQGTPIALGDTTVSLGKVSSPGHAVSQYTIDMPPAAGYAVQEHKFRERRIRNRSQLEIIYDISTTLMQSLDVHEICEKIINALFRHLKRIDGGFVILLDPDTGNLQSIVEKSRKGAKYTYSRTIVKRVLSEGKAIMMPDTQLEPEENLADSIERMKIKSIMCVPLMSETQARGAIYVHSTSVPQSFRKEDLLMLTGLSSPAALALENALLFSKTKTAEEALKKSHEHLEEQVANRTAEIERANVVLTQEMEEREKAEAALRKSEERFRELAELLPEPIFEMDMHGTLTFVNRKAYDHFGYTQKDFKQGLTVINMLKAEDRDRAAGNMMRVLKGENIGLTEYTALRKDGSTFPCIIHSSPIMRDEEAVGLRGFIIDITERKQADEDKRRLEAQLYHAQKIEAIGTLAGGIAHNFNNLLMGIMGNVGLVLSEIDPSDVHYGRLRNIEKLVASGSKLTNQLLGYARKGRYEIKPFDLNQVVRDTTDTFQVTKREIRIHYDLADESMGVRGDASQIEQVLLNLYVNAGDAMPGGGDLFLKTARVSEKDMHGKSYKPRPGIYVLVTLKDTGVGMDRKTKERIFDPFFTTKGLSKGTGLGLASVYGIIKAHGGYIDVNSEKGKGTTFRVYLPASDIVIQESAIQGEQVSEGTGTILIVDDEEVILEVGTAMLEELGYTVFKATGGKEALEILRDNVDIDMVLLDMVMPDMGGGETFDEIKRMAPDVKVLLSSGYSIDGEAKEILQRGCNGFIQKPFDMSQLSKKVKDVMEMLKGPEAQMK